MKFGKIKLLANWGFGLFFTIVLAIPVIFFSNTVLAQSLSETVPVTNTQKTDDSENIKASQEYEWQDGDISRHLSVSHELVMERYDADNSRLIPPEDIVVANGKLRIVKRYSKHKFGDNVFPVLVLNGSWRALPGGVVVVLTDRLQPAEVSTFFASRAIDANRVSKMEFATNAFFISTEPGIVALELSNDLAATEQVVLTTPNWWSLEQLR